MNSPLHQASLEAFAPSGHYIPGGMSLGKDVILLGNIGCEIFLLRIAMLIITSNEPPFPGKVKHISVVLQLIL